MATTWPGRAPAVLAAACALLAGTVALAGPAAAIDDRRRPSAQVTHGPSCGPAVIRVAVTNGTQPHRVALVFDGTAEQGSAELAGGEQAELASEDLDWGETVDVSLAVFSADGTAEAPIEFGTYTRPSAEDCDAAAQPTDPDPGPEPTTPTPSPTSTTPADPATPSASAPVPVPAPAPGTPWSPPTPPTPPRTSDPAPAPAPASEGTADPTSASPTSQTPDGKPREENGSASAASVSPGGVVTVRATGFSPGETVTVSLGDADDPLTTVTAAQDGSVQAVVQIPRGAALGTATVQLVGEQSAATAGLDLQVAARGEPLVEQTTSGPVLAAGIGLIGAAGVLGLLAARRSRADRSTMPR